MISRVYSTDHVCVLRVWSPHPRIPGRKSRPLYEVRHGRRLVCRRLTEDGARRAARREERRLGDG